MTCTASRKTLCLHLVLLFIYVVLSVYVVCINRYHIHPDGVAYQMIARHYAHGHWDIAVSSHWGPMISWLLAVPIRLGVDGVLAAKVLGIALGIGFAYGARSAYLALFGRAGADGVLALCLGLSLPMLTDAVRPDLLLTCVMSWYLAGSARLMLKPCWTMAVLTGVAGGMAYLCKAYALPFVCVHLVMTMMVSWSIHRRRKRTATFRWASVLGAGVFVFLVGLPWIVVISIEDGRFQIGSAGQFIRSWRLFDQENQNTSHRLLMPRKGRLTSWESPVEIPYDWPTWHPTDGVSGLEKQLRTLYRTGRHTISFMKDLDMLSLLMAALVATGLRTCMPNQCYSGRLVGLLMVLSVIVYAAGYSVMFMVPRYLWPMQSYLAVMTIGLVFSVVDKPVDRNDGGRLNRWLCSGRLFRVVTAMVIAVSVLWTISYTIYSWRGPGGKQAYYRWLYEIGTDIDGDEKIAANEFEVGCRIAFWSDRPFIGQYLGRHPDSLVSELKDFGPTTVLVLDDVELEDRLRVDARFEPLGVFAHKKLGYRCSVFRFVTDRPGSLDELGRPSHLR